MIEVYLRHFHTIDYSDVVWDRSVIFVNENEKENYRKRKNNDSVNEN